MPLLLKTLANGLENMEATDDEPTAIKNFVDAWETYFSQASVSGVLTAPGTLTAALTSMKAGLVGLHNPNTGASLLQIAITTFWATVAASAATIWVVVPPILTATPPPGLGGIGVALTAAFSANQTGKLDLAASALAVATAIHPTQIGGVTAQGPPPTAGTIV